jgi:hypothetical protein
MEGFVAAAELVKNELAEVSELCGQLYIREPVLMDRSG